MKPFVVVNADDLGLDAATNQIIFNAFEHQVISSATLMANMPAFANACAGVRKRGLSGHVGLHFNLTYGRPLSQAIAAQSVFCNSQGEFDMGLSRFALRLPAGAAAAARQELEAQWQRCVDHGVQPSHIDSHQHVHNLWPIVGIVARFAGEKGVPVRLARNVGANIGVFKRVFKTAVNWRIRSLAAGHVRYVCTPRDLLDGRVPMGAIEVVAHPTEISPGEFGDDYLPMGQSLTRLLDLALPGNKRVPYGNFAKRR